ncbi:UNVERIFIED_CONTAM: hypothetical protein FKN15_028510 [Acipenser sinensis]
MTEPSSEVASVSSLPPLPSSMPALRRRAANFLQIPWNTPTKSRQSVFRTHYADFMQEVRSSWDRPASVTSVLKQAARLAELEDAEKLGLASFPSVDSTIVALVKALPVGGSPRGPM